MSSKCNAVVLLAFAAGLIVILSSQVYAFGRPYSGNVDEAQSWIDQGDALYKNGDFRDAEAAYFNALSYSPDYDVAEQGFARTEAALGNYKLAEQYYRSVIEERLVERVSSPIIKVDLTTEYVLVLLRAGAISEAIAIYNEAVNYTKPWRSDAALKTLKTDGSDFDPTDVEAMTHVLRAIIANPYQLDTIKTEWQAALKIDPHSTEVNSYTGYMSAKMKEAARQVAVEEGMKKAVKATAVAQSVNP